MRIRVVGDTVKVLDETDMVILLSSRQFGPNVFSTRSQDWKRHRTILTPAFSTDS